MRTIEKTLNVQFKAHENEDDEPGTFTAIVSCFGNVDRDGEMVAKGAFMESLAQKSSFPVIWTHDWLRPPVGVSKSAVEVEEGLKVKGRFFIGKDEDSQLAREIWTAMKAGAITEWSFGAGVKSERYEEKDGKNITILESLDLVEFGPTLKGSNPDTRTVSIKSAEKEAVDRLLQQEETPINAVVEETPTHSPEDRHAVACILF